MTTRRFLTELSRRALPFLALVTLGCASDEATNPWSNETFLLDIDSVDWAEPRGIGKGIDDFVPSFLIHVSGEDPKEFDVTLGVVKNGTQDRCNRTSVVAATANPPRSTIGPSEVPLFIQHASDPSAVEGTIYDLTIENVLPNGDDPADSGRLSATLDFRELYPLVTVLLQPTPDSVCASFEKTYAAPCAPCPSDGEPYCLTVEATYLGATPTDTPVEAIDAVDPSCLPPSE